MKYITVGTYKRRNIWSKNKIHNGLYGELAIKDAYRLVWVITFEHQERRKTEAIFSGTVNQ